jgi:hypothetical protein
VQLVVPVPATARLYSEIWANLNVLLYTPVEVNPVLTPVPPVQPAPFVIASFAVLSIPPQRTTSVRLEERAKELDVHEEPFAFVTAGGVPSSPVHAAEE